MSAAVIYYYWSNSGEPVWTDHRNPILLSIATLRKFERSLPVYVIDASNNHIDWGDYWLRLGIDIRRRDHPLRHIEPKINAPEGVTIQTRLMAKSTAVYELAQNVSANTIIFCDSDVFWVKSPFPLGGNFSEKFCARSNTGVFYFDRGSPNSHKVMNTWNAFCSHACINTRFANTVSKAMKQQVLNDEVILNFVQKNNAGMFQEIPIYENFPFIHLSKPEYDVRKAKNIHVHNTNFKAYYPKKSYACLCVKELRDIVTEMLGEDQMLKIFGDDYHNVVSFSMYDQERMNALNKGEGA